MNKIPWYKRPENRALVLANHKSHVERNRDKYNEYNKRSREKTKEKRNEYCKKYRQTHKAEREAWRIKNLYRWTEYQRVRAMKLGNWPQQEWRYCKECIEWKISVWKRDNYTCTVCGKTHCKVFAHHIKQGSMYPELRYDINNGTTLCQQCHINIHKSIHT